MANRYWVGGSGIWDTTSTTNWATTSGGAPGASAPGSVDIANFDANSGSDYTVTLGANLSILSLNANLSSNFTIDFVSYKISVNGNNGFVWRASSITSYLGTPVIELTYSGATGTRNIIPNNSNVSFTGTPLSINVLAGTDIVNLSTASTNVYKNLNFTGFSGTLSFGSVVGFKLYGDIKLSTGMTISTATITPWSFLATSSTQKITTNGKTIDFPLTFNGSGSTFEFQDALTQGSTRAFTITNGTVQLKAGTTSTVGAFATSGTTQKYLESTQAGTQATLSQASGIVNASYLTIKDINATGGATWRAYLTSSNVNAGNNLGWDFALQLGKYMYSRRKNKRILP